MNIKLSNELIKERLKDDFFKEFYQGLGEDEKNEVRNKIITQKELKDAISECNNHSAQILQDVAGGMLRDEILAKGFKRVYSKKAKLFATSKIFTYKICDNYFVAVKAVPNKKVLDIHVKVILEIPTHKGKLYYTLNNTSASQTLITGHFFDRYKERLNLEGTRDEIVTRYLSDTMLEAGLMLLDHEQDCVYCPMGTGLALGTLLYDVYLLKTYISEKQLNGFQKKIIRQMEQYI